MRIFHLATLADWEAAQASGRYTTSTRGRTLAEEGFIHASRADQWQGVRDRFYADVTEPLVLLVIDTDLLTAPVVEEHVPGTEETFPHVYGAIEPAAVVKALPLGTTPANPGQATAPTTPTPPSRSFAGLFLAEVGVRAGIGINVLALAVLLGLLTLLFSGAAAALVVMLVTIVAGLGLGAWFLRRRDRRYWQANQRS
jgi:uncharacterized protein (DUF952 family)